MNKILQINLGGYALTIDEDAYQHLSVYLDDIRQRLGTREERDEIMRDIEARLGEIITGRLGTRSIATMADVEAAIAIMGKPEDFGGEAEASGGGKEKATFRAGRRLYRDESDAVIGGVCSGLAAYFGLNDPVWVRLVFILLSFISFGFWVPAYILLWILVPPARTAAERLAMRGEMPNVENIVREVEQGAERFSRRASAFGQQAGQKVGTASGTLAEGCASFFARFLKGMAIFIAIGLVFALGTAWVAGTVAFFAARPDVAAYSPLPVEAAYLGFVNLFFLMGIPVIGLAIWLMRTIFRLNSPAWLGIGLSVLWILNLISFGVLASWSFSQYREEGTSVRSIDFSQMTSDTLFVRFASQTEDDRYQGETYDVQIGPFRRGKVKVGPSVIRIEQSASGRYEGDCTIYARGASEDEAREYAERTHFQATLSSNTLTLPAKLKWEKGAWRGQYAEVRLMVPVGKHIVFEKGVHRRVRAEYADDTYKVKHNPGQAFQMTLGGLICPSCTAADGSEIFEGPVEHFIIEGNLDVDITHDETFSIHYPENASGAERISVVRKGRTLIISGKKNGGPIRCSVHTSVFTSLVAKGHGQVAIRGFEEGRSSITAHGPMRIRGMYKSDELKVILDDKASVELIGEGEQLNAILSGGARLEAGSWAVEAASVTAANGSEARINATNTVDIRTDANSSVHTIGPGSVRQM